MSKIISLIYLIYIATHHKDINKNVGKKFESNIKCNTVYIRSHNITDSLSYVPVLSKHRCSFLCDFDRGSSLICGNKMPTRYNRGVYCRSYNLLNMFRASLCPSSGAPEYYTVVAACGISCCGFQVVGLVWS